MFWEGWIIFFPSFFKIKKNDLRDEIEKKLATEQSDLVASGEIRKSAS